MTLTIDSVQHLKTWVNLRSPLPAGVPQWLQNLREQAANHSQELALPSTNDEAWRFTDISPLKQVNFVPSAGASAVTPHQIANLTLPETPLRVVFVNGCFAPELSALTELPAGLQVASLLNHPSSAAESELAKLPGAEEVFTTLNTASFLDVAVIRVERNAHIGTPLHVLWVTTAETTMLTNPRCLVVAEPGSTLTLIEEFVDLGAESAFTNSVTEIWLGHNAELQYSRCQHHAQTSYHIGKTVVSQARDSRYTCTAISVGGKISRHNLDVHLTGEQTSTQLCGLTLATGEQLADTHSSLRFHCPYGTSNQVHKCIVSDKARAVFNGQVSVPKAAQLTNAAQLSRNLLLSNKARVDTKPELEIVADNVKCTHGATVSQLDADEIFYLQSRGLDPQSAAELLVRGFALETLDLLPLASLRDRLTDLILAQLHS
jgi:Fe-S cluster assembly protein SufD